MDLSYGDLLLLWGYMGRSDKNGTKISFERWCYKETQKNPSSPCHQLHVLLHICTLLCLILPEIRAKQWSASVSGCETTTKHDPLAGITFCLVWLYKTYSLLVCAQREKNHTLIWIQRVCVEICSVQQVIGVLKDWLEERKMCYLLGLP